MRLVCNLFTFYFDKKCQTKNLQELYNDFLYIIDLDF